MHAEQQEIAEFLKTCPPINLLPADLIQEMLVNLEVCYFKKGTSILQFQQPTTHWFIIRSGAVEVFRRNGELYNRIGEKGYFGEFGLLRDNKVRFPVQALEDTLCYAVPYHVFSKLFEQCEPFADYVEVEDVTRLKQTTQQLESDSMRMTAFVSAVIHNPPCWVSETATVKEAAQALTDTKLTALLITSKETSTDLSHVTGIVTDRDFRQRIVAQGLSYDTRVSEIITPNPITIGANRYIFEAIMLMLRHGAHHLPVVKNNQIIGLVSQEDLIQHQSQSSFFLINEIHNANSVNELTPLKTQVQQVFVRLVFDNANFRLVGSAMASIGRAFNQKLIELAEKELGPPPVNYCFLALGSMAREEQLFVTDQDNGIILSNAFDHKKHNEYFQALGDKVCAWLDACGYPLCTGAIMASNPKWRMTLNEWKQQFSEWILKPSGEGLLNCSVFFDLDGLYGQLNLAKDLAQEIAKMGSERPKFLSCMARNAVLRTPPLGFFKNFVVEKDGTHRNTFNLKRRGAGPLSDLARVHALASKSANRNTFARLEAARQANTILPEQAEALGDAMEFISIVRMRHQARAIHAKQKPDNQVDPRKLTDFERKNLKDAFQILSDAQKFLRFKHQAPVGP